MEGRETLGMTGALPRAHGGRARGARREVAR